MIRFTRCMRRCIISASTLAAAAYLSASPCKAQVVKKLAEGFESASWRSFAYATAPGSILLSDEAGPDTQSKHSLLIEARFNGTFGGFGGSPAQPMVIPGEVNTSSLKVKTSDVDYAITVNFRDG